ncbi:DUF6204 family protein [Streptomyces avicenniae]|uniref:DUF6204 family protein n=1 Tax=Streptomyces avicenniae TaxID=500153 RepID=UPI00069AD2C7|nr:DUF6204 family protein [Streptomyces avicenniae]
MFRVTIRGTFDGLTDAQRAALRAGEGVPVGPAYTEAGAFTFDSSVAVFSFRCEVPAEEPEDGDDEATLRALAALDAYGYRYTARRIAVTDMRAVKIRRPPRGRGRSA